MPEQTLVERIVREAMKPQLRSGDGLDDATEEGRRLGKIAMDAYSAALSLSIQ